MSRREHGWIPGQWFGTFFLGLFLCGTAYPAMPMVPPVKDWRETGDQLTIKAPLQIDTQDRLLFQILADEIALHGAQAKDGVKGKPNVLLGLIGETKIDLELAASKLTDAVPQQPESYLISIGSRGVLATARDKAGLFYAVQSLRQLIRPADGGIAMPGGVIRDWPEMSFRGLSVDLGQGAVPTEDQMRRIIETCAEYKLNVVSFYIQHLVPFRSTPLLAPKYAELNLEELRRLVTFAEQHHVTLMPQQQTFGHLHHLLKHELYADLGEVPHGSTLTANDPDVYRWIDGVADELCPIFLGKLFHAGGDETWDLGKGVNRKAVEADGGQGKQWAAHMVRVADILRGHNRRTLFWGDIALKKPEIIPELSRDMIAATWTYNADSQFPDFITPFRKAGLDVIVCPSANNWSKPAPDFNVAIKNIGGFVAEGKHQGAMGMLNTVWFDDGESLFDTVWYPVVYSAAASWTGTNIDRECFDESYDWAFHRAEGHAIAGAIRKLGDVHEKARCAGLTDAGNELVWLDPFSNRGTRIYSRLLPHASEMRHIAEEALTAIVQNRNRCRLHTNVLDHLDFAARRMDWLGMKVQFSAEITALYQHALDNTNDTRQVNYAFLSISDINGRVQDLRDAAGELKEQYRTLWLASHRSYLLNSMLALYDRELLYWLNKSDRFAEARIGYRKTRMLPEPSVVGLAE